MADVEVDYESDSAMAMEEEEEEKKQRDVNPPIKSERGSRCVELTTTDGNGKDRRVVKGRGKGTAAMDSERYPDETGVFEKLSDGSGSSSRRDHSSAIASVEGWILIVTGVHEEAQEETLLDEFGEDAPVKNLHMNLDRRSGFVKGYALIEFGDYEAAKDAIERMDGKEVCGSKIRVDWAFRKEAGNENNRGRDGGRARGGRR